MYFSNNLALAAELDRAAFDSAIKEMVSEKLIFRSVDD